MSADDLNASPTGRRPHSYWICLWLLFLGMTLALAGNVYQLIRTKRLAHDVDLMQRNTQRQIADVKEALFGELEQDLRRYDEMSKQLHQISSMTLAQARSDVKRSSSELARTLDRSHQEVVSQLSNLRSDLKENTSSKVAQISSDLEQTDSELRRVASNLDVVRERVESSSGQVKTELAVPPAEPAAQGQPPPPPKKKQFWSKLNPFRSGKRKTVAAGDPAE
jgi:hypothetical protein